MMKSSQLCCVVTLALLSVVSLADTFELKHQSGKMFGPYEFEHKGVIKVANATFTIIRGRGATRPFKLKHHESGKDLGPFPFSSGTAIPLGKSVFTLIRAGEQPAAEAKGEKEKPGLKLAPFWKASSLKGGSRKMSEFAEIVGTHATPGVDLEPHPEISIYRGITYLMPLKEATGKLGVGRVSSRISVGHPAFPKSSFSYHKFHGTFEDACRTCILVTDKAGQVVAVQLLNESPSVVRLRGHTSERSSYNFIQNRNKGNAKWKTAKSVVEVAHCLEIRSELIDKKRKAKEYTKLYLPLPVAKLCMHVIGTASSR